jgi:TonB family protein
MHRLILLLLVQICLVGKLYASAWDSKNFIDAMTDHKLGLVEATSIVDNKRATSAGVFTLICETNSYQLYFYINRHEKSQARPTATQYRIDNNKVIELKSSTKHQSPLSMTLQNILKQMQTGKVLRIRQLYPMGGMSDIALYNLKGFNQAFQQSCKQREKYRKKFIQRMVIEQKENRKYLNKAMDEMLIEEERVFEVKAKLTRRKIINQHQVLIKNKIARNINFTLKSKQNRSVSFNIWMISNGTVITVLLTKSSGDTDFDQAINDAILKASPMPVPLKKDIFNQSFKIMPYTYDYKIN